MSSRMSQEMTNTRQTQQATIDYLSTILYATTTTECQEHAIYRSFSDKCYFTTKAYTFLSMNRNEQKWYEQHAHLGNQGRFSLYGLNSFIYPDLRTLLRYPGLYEVLKGTFEPQRDPSSPTMSNELELKAIAHLSLLLHASTAIDRQEESLFKSFDNACVIRRQTALQSTPASANRYKEAICQLFGLVQLQFSTSCNQTINNRTIDHTSNYVEQFTAADRQEATLLESFETACRAHRKEVATTWTIIDPDSEFHWYQYSAADTARQKRQVDSFSLPMQRFFKIPMNLMKGEGWTARFVKWKNDMFRMGMRVWVGKMGRGDDVGWVG
ncbi:MAG: hypothetical protein Q9159_006278 [Coniocarpon cinnabarinum]